MLFCREVGYSQSQYLRGVNRYLHITQTHKIMLGVAWETEADHGL